MHIDPWILTFSAVTVIATVLVGFWSAKKSKTASDFFVAGRSVSVGWNASAISGEYLSAASFMGVAGMVMSSGYDALWYPVCYACGYLFLLLFIAGPLRRFGAYTIPDFAEGRFDSPLFRKIAVVFVLFIGFFYTMPQMKGAGTTLSYIFQDVDLRNVLPDFLLSHDAIGHPARGLPYWVGVALVGAVITLNVALGGMKGITLVQAFQYWAKMFAISVPVFVLMTVYGHYGKQLTVNNSHNVASSVRINETFHFIPARENSQLAGKTFDEILNLVESDPNEQPRQTAEYKGVPLELLAFDEVPLIDGMVAYENAMVRRAFVLSEITNKWISFRVFSTNFSSPRTAFSAGLRENGVVLIEYSNTLVFAVSPSSEILVRRYLASAGLKEVATSPLPEKAPKDSTWISPFGPLTTKAAKTTAAALAKRAIEANHAKNPQNQQKPPSVAKFDQLTPENQSPMPEIQGLKPDGQGSKADLQKSKPEIQASKGEIQGLKPENQPLKTEIQGTTAEIQALTPEIQSKNAEKAWLSKHEKPLALLYTYSLIIALVCGTAGLPHILVRFYTNPDGVAAKRTTMWVMILIGVFYLFPPVFGVMGRNLLPSLYEGVGAKGTDKVVLELPRILNQKGEGMSRDGSKGGEGKTTSAPSFTPSQPSRPSRDTSGIPWGSILSGITCAGAFAAFMSTFSGLLVSMTGALAHDVYGRMLRPKSTPEQRLRAFKICAVICGVGAILLGFLVETFEINKMVGWAFAIAATSYFPLLFLSTWWRGITMKGAATGMLVGGTLSLIVIASTMFADEAKWAKPLADFYNIHPLLRILAEQPAIWALPLALFLMIFISKLTRKNIPADIRMKMLVLHAPEKLGLKQEYIQEHQGH